MGKRTKQYRKLMHQYALTFQFREPYQVLVDAQIVQDAARFKMDLVGGLERTLQGKVKPMITQCSMRHLYTLPTDESLTAAAKSALIDQAKSFERRRCNHHELEEPLSTLECLSSVVDPTGKNVNKHRYVVASQEVEVRARLREVLGVPLVYIHRSVMIMEPMTLKSREVREREEKGKFRAGLTAMRGAKRKHTDEEARSPSPPPANVPEPEPAQTDRPAKKKRKGPSGPNPLSVKKPKKNAGQDNTGKPAQKEPHHDNASPPPADGTKKKRRRRKHGPASDPAREAGEAESHSD